jgi:membrane protein
MPGLISVIKTGWGFLTKKLWVVRIHKLTKGQGFIVKQLRIYALAIKGFNEDKCLVKATALTFYTLFSIVPILALVFGIAKGFGYEKNLQDQIMANFSQYSNVLGDLFESANKLLATTQGGLIAGVGIALLLWSVMNLLISIENCFNEIWEIKKGRTWFRKITDYLTISIIAPIFVILSTGLTVLIKAELTHVVFLSQSATVLLKVIAFLMMSGVFTLIYVILPNTKVNLRSAFAAGVFCTLFLELLQWVYLSFQIGAVRYNAIYGSFAALPLLLIWMQYSWYVVLFGAELAFANQNVDHYELENEIENMSVRYRRVIALMITNLVVKNFNEGNKAFTAMEISKKLDLPIRLSRNLINELVETKVFIEVKLENDKDAAYQPGISDSKLTVKYIIDKLDEKGINELPISDSNELKTIHGLMLDMDQVLNNAKGNIPVKDIC